MNKPHFIIKNHFQKSDLTYKKLLSRRILSDVCKRITGHSEFSCTFDNDGYNKGRLAVLEYAGESYYISFSEVYNRGRNSFFQSVPSALNGCIIDSGATAKLYFYFLPIEGSYKTNYHKFMYRLLHTAGVTFLNQEEFLDKPIQPFISVEDLVRARDVNRQRNRSNNSTFVTVDGNRTVQIYAKVFGASKYESELLALSLLNITEAQIEIVEIRENGLVELPKSSLQALSIVGRDRIKVTIGDMTLERNEFEKEDSLRSPRYVYNLLNRLGSKKCALCQCNIPEIIQGAHIWGVSQIKREPVMSADEKLSHAINGHNGLWLCENHHKMFDTDVIRFTGDGSIVLRNKLIDTQVDFIRSITPSMRIPAEIMTSEMQGYLSRRYVA